jgi:glycosyltransferase involved in cell wall biosynthesis
MRVLIITNHPIDRKEGGCIASRAYINAFSNIFKDCMLIYPANGNGNGNGNCNEISHLVNPWLKTVPCKDQRPKWIKGLGVYIGKLHRFKRTTKKWLKLYKPDIVVFDSAIVSLGLIDLVKRLKIKIVTIHHNVEIDFFSDNLLPIQIRLPYLYYLKKAERNALLKSNLDLTLTENDTCRLKTLYAPDKNLNIRCLGVFEPEKHALSDLPYRSDFRDSKKINIVITGSLAYSQNNLSIVEFLNDYFPVIRDLQENVIITIGGSKPSEQIKSMCNGHPQLRLISDPENLLKIVSEGDVYVCPINRGSGLKLRIMDSLKLGIPTIVHEVSARGYESFIKAGIIFPYNSVPTFMTALQKVLDCQFDSEKIKKLYNETFSFESGVSRMETILTGNL